MTTPFLTTEAAVREVLDLNASASSRFSDQVIGSNIRDASWYLERVTRRIFRDESSLTLKFTTNGQSAVYLPGLRTASSILFNSGALVDGTSCWLIPDVQQTGQSLAIQVRPYDRSGPYWQYPDWFDRNLDSPKWSSYGDNGGLPNDLVISGAWGYTEPTLPEPVRRNTARLAAFFCLRSDALLSGARATENGIFDLSQWPIEVQAFVASWHSGPQAVGM
jgi:hypothetical protein